MDNIENNQNLEADSTKLHSLYARKLILDIDNDNLSEIIKQASKGKVLVLKDEIVLALTVLIDILILVLPLPNILINMLIIYLSTALISSLQVYNNCKNKKLIYYYKKVNNLNENKNINITNKKIKNVMNKFISLKKSSDIELKNVNSSIKILEESISKHNTRVKDKNKQIAIGKDYMRIIRNNFYDCGHKLENNRPYRKVLVRK